MISITHVFLLSLVFAAVAGATFATTAYLGPSRMKARLRQIAGDTDVASSAAEGPWKHRIVEAISPASKLSQPSAGWQDSPLRLRFMRAGWRDDSAPVVFFATKTIFALALPLVLGFVAGIGAVPMAFNAVLALIVALAAIGYYLPNLYLRKRIADRQQELRATFPDAVDLMTVAVEAGLALNASIVRVGQEIGSHSRALETEIRLVGLELRAGATREQALRNFALRIGVEEVDVFVSMLIQAHRFGTSIADSLRVHADAMRTKRSLRAEETAAKISLKLLFPLIFCIFPSMMLVLLGPAFISIYRAFLPVAGGS
jgi:tight adherence protein C